jgi:hypothetical protein
MECHNERAARSRRHHEKKKRAKAKLDEAQKREAAAQVGKHRRSAITRSHIFTSNKNG